MSVQLVAWEYGYVRVRMAGSSLAEVCHTVP